MASLTTTGTAFLLMLNNGNFSLQMLEAQVSYPCNEAMKHTE